jgi:hypothetical protein
MTRPPNRIPALGPATWSAIRRRLGRFATDPMARGVFARTGVTPRRRAIRIDAFYWALAGDAPVDPHRRP